MKRLLLLVAVLLGGSAACSNTPNSDKHPDAGMQADASRLGDAGSPDPKDDGSVSPGDAGPTMDAGVAGDDTDTDADTDTDTDTDEDEHEDQDAGPAADEVQPGLQFNGATTIVRWEP